MDKNKNKIFVSGFFNTLHPGHIRLLKFARSLGNELVVGIISKKIISDKTYNSDNSRIETLKSINFIDQVILINSSLEKTLLKVKPNIIVKGREHENTINAENKIIKKIGAKIVFNSGGPTSEYDTTDQNFKKQNLDIQKKYLQKHKIDTEVLIKYIENFKKLKICVIGDIIIDEYISCVPLGMSHEDPTIVVSPTNNSKFLGGAGIVAAHASNLGAKVNFISIVGNDEISKFCKKKLNEFKVNNYLLKDSLRPTILKQRFITNSKTQLKVTYVNQTSIEKKIQKQILNRLKKIIKNIDMLVFSDFNYGCLPQNLVEKIIYEAKKENIFVVADSQSSSQVGNISRFKSLDLITPTEREARIALQNNDDGLIVLSESLKKKCESKNIILTLGEAGILMYNPLEETDRLPTFNLNPLDVSGSGDSLYITASMIMALGGDIWSAGFLGSVAASIQSSRIGNLPINASNLRSKIEDLI